MPGKNTDRREAAQKALATCGQKTAGSNYKASALAEARGRLREPFDKKHGSSSSSPSEEPLLCKPERRETPKGGGRGVQNHPLTPLALCER